VGSSPPAESDGEGDGDGLGEGDGDGLGEGDGDGLGEGDVLGDGDALCFGDGVQLADGRGVGLEAAPVGIGFPLPATLEPWPPFVVCDGFDSIEFAACWIWRGSPDRAKPPATATATTAAMARAGRSHA
jgi:hypothetical protein